MGAAFRYKHGTDVFVIQNFTSLEGGGDTKHTRHAGHLILRGYEAPSGAAVIWSDGGTTSIFTGPGTVDEVLDIAMAAVFGTKSGTSQH